MPKQDRSNHTPAKQFRLGDLTLSRIDAMAEAMESDRTTIIRQAVREMHERWAKKNREKSGLPS